MACELIAGYTIECSESIGGIDAIYIAEFDNITAIAEASGVVTGITKASGKRFWKFQVPTKSSAIATSNPIQSIENGTLYWEQRVEFPINKRDVTTRNIVSALVKLPVIVVTKDKDGTYRMYGKYAGLSGEGSTGTTSASTSPGDPNGYKIGLAGIEREDFFVLDSATAAALETAG